MHTYLLQVGLVGQNSMESVNRVKLLLKESLVTDFENSNKMLKQRMDTKLVDILGGEENFHLWVDSMWRSSTPQKKSFFVNIMVKNKKHIIITAQYKDVNTLKDMAAMVVARCFKDKKDVDKLEDVPKCVFEDIKQFL